jgi:CubicO group peptidase (beta-lactamase class C family)
MRSVKLAACVVMILALSGSVAVTSSHAAEYWPAGSEWAAISPEEAGMDSAKLDDAVANMMAQNSLGVMVLRGGRIVAEEYADDWGRDKSRKIASATKSMVAILVGMALEEGKFTGLDHSISDFAPQWKGTPKEAITLRHMLSMTSGLNGRGFRVSNARGDQFEVNSKMPLDHEPGTVWNYNTPAYHMLFRIIEKATGESLESYAQRKLFGPMGMEHTTWMKDEADGVTNYYRAICSTRDLARFGLFALRGGRWRDKQLVSEEFFKLATTPSQEMNPAYGFLWWLNAEKGTPPRGGTADYRFRDAPRDTVAAMGAQGQIVIAIPSLDLVVVRQGNRPKNEASLSIGPFVASIKDKE